MPTPSTAWAALAFTPSGTGPVTSAAGHHCGPQIAHHPEIALSRQGVNGIRPAGSVRSRVPLHTVQQSPAGRGV